MKEIFAGAREGREQEEKLELGFGHVKVEVSIRHPNGIVQQGCRFQRTGGTWRSILELSNL